MGKVSVNCVKGKLYLLAALPPKSGDGTSKPQRVATGLDDTPADRKVAERRRAVMQRQVDEGTFSWDDWIDIRRGHTFRQAVDMLYRKRVVLGRTGETTWRISYWGRLKQLPLTEIVSTKGLELALGKYQRDSASYKELFFLLKDLAQLVKVEFPEAAVPTYGSKTKPPAVPDDDEIVQWVQKAMREDPELGWVLGLIATYGLRPHESDDSRFIDDKHRLEVPSETKTGDRIVIPVHKEWVELFDLRNEKRRLKVSLEPDATSQWIHAHNKKIGFPYKTYSLRHAFAGRLWRVGGSRLDVFSAARLMGHDAKTHSRTYRAFIRPFHVAEAAERALYGD